MNLTQNGQDLYNLNYKVFLRETTEDWNKWRDCYELEDSVLRYQFLPNWSIDSLQSQVNLYGNAKDLENPKQLLKKESNVGVILPDFKSYYKPTVVKVIWYWHQDRQIN